MASLEDVKKSMKPKEVTVEWEGPEGTLEVPMKFLPMSFSETMLLAKKADREGEDRFDLQYELLTKSVKKKNEEGEYVRLTKNEIKDLPQGFVLKLTMELNDYLGLGETENFPEQLNKTNMPNP